MLLGMGAIAITQLPWAVRLLRGAADLDYGCGCSRAVLPSMHFFALLRRAVSVTAVLDCCASM
jgi:hypothetical protein